MPIITVSWAEGRTIEQKGKIVEGFTQIMVDVVGVSKDSVTVLFHDLPRNNIGTRGKLLQEK